jgi:hypothetical protein
MSDRPFCPACRQNDEVEKVSTLYIAGIGVRKKRQAQATALDKLLSPQEIAALSQRLTPPASGKQVLTRPIHPDQALIAFSVVAPIFVYGIFTSQRAMLLPVLLLLAGFYGVYIWLRGALLRRYQQEQASRQASAERVKRGLKLWMGLYYCLRDDAVFELRAKETTPLDFLPGLLNRQP